MSPKSQVKWKGNQKMARDAARHTELPLDSNQDIIEMGEVVSTIEEQCQDELEKLFSEGDKHGVGQNYA